MSLDALRKLLWQNIQELRASNGDTEKGTPFPIGNIFVISTVYMKKGKDIFRSKIEKVPCSFLFL